MAIGACSALKGNDRITSKRKRIKIIKKNSNGNL
jgi:hypothetical protein